MPLWLPTEQRSTPALWYRTGYWSPQNLYFVLDWMFDEPWIADGKHIAIDVECLVSGLLTLAPKAAPSFEQFPRDQPTPAIDPDLRPEPKRGYAVACQVLDDPRIGDEPFVLSGSNWSWTSFCEDNFNRTLRFFGEGYVPVLRMLPAEPLALKNGGTTAKLHYQPAGWIRRAPEMIAFASDRGVIDESIPPVLSSAAPPEALAFTGPVPPLRISAPAPASDYAKAKSRPQAPPSAPRPAPAMSSVLDDDTIPFIPDR